MSAHLLRSYALWSLIALTPTLWACGDDSSSGGGAGGSAGTGGSAGAAGSAGSGGATGGAGAGGSAGAAGSAGSGGSAGTAGSAGTGGSAGVSCHAGPPPTRDHVQLVVSHPYTAASAQSPRYELVQVDGTSLTRGPSFDLGRTFLGEIVFTPDGQIGFVADDSGKLGVFRLTESGPEVVYAQYSGGFYAGAVVMDPSGGTLYVQDQQWRENGGGVYALDIACDGSLSNERKLFDSKLPYGMAFDPQDPSRAVVYARDLGDSPSGEDVHLLRWGQQPTRSAGVRLFGDDEAQISTLVMTHDSKFALVGDTAGFSAIPNRVGVASITEDGVTAAQVLPDIEDPIDLVTSPYNNAALIISGFGERIVALDYDPSSAQPFTIRGEISYSDAGPQLPGYAVSIDQGPLKGRVFVAENVGVRVLQFAENGDVTDLGVLSFGMGVEEALGSIGVVP